ncbi:MAG: hypothetical protein IT385_28850 [Deltaproteobacteria bacterium]|nr:hypothetical protein [Deltaproteobacteria bacterium]
MSEQPPAPAGAAFIVQKAQQRGIAAVELATLDLSARPVAVTVPIGGLEAALEDGLAVPHALLDLRAGDEVVLAPDARTFNVATDIAGLARVIADLQTPTGAPSPWCARTVLKRQLGRANGLGYTYYIGATVEHRWLDAPGEPRPLRPGAGAALARAAAVALEASGVAVRALHPVRGGDPSHWAFDLDWVDPLTLADSLVAHRRIVREVARAHGHDVTFMPLPWVDGRRRSRLDLYVSLVEGGAPSYTDALDPAGLTPAARALAEWLASEVPALELVFQSTVNSYTLPELPRVVAGVTGRGEGGAAVHVRGPDSAANPYLTLALVIGVGLLAAQAPPPAHRPTPAATLRDAARAAERATAVRDVLGAELLERLVSRAHDESRAWREQVTPWEVARYLDR